MEGTEDSGGDLVLQLLLQIANERRESHADALRELARSLKGKLSPEALEDLKEFGDSGSPEAQKRLAEGLERALEGLTPEERKRLAERMQRELEREGSNASPMTKQQLEEMAKQLGRKEGIEQLEKRRARFVTIRVPAFGEKGGDAFRKRAHARDSATIGIPKALSTARIFS